IQLLAEGFMTNRDHKQSVMSLLPLIAALFIVSPVRLIAQSSPSSASAPKPAYSHELPAMDGNHLRVFVSDIEVAPGESSPPHSHPCVDCAFLLVHSYFLILTSAFLLLDSDLSYCLGA